MQSRIEDEQRVGGAARSRIEDEQKCGIYYALEIRIRLVMIQ